MLSPRAARVQPRPCCQRARHVVGDDSADPRIGQQRCVVGGHEVPDDHGQPGTAKAASEASVTSGIFGRRRVAPQAFARSGSRSAVRSEDETPSDVRRAELGQLREHGVEERGDDQLATAPLRGGGELSRSTLST